MKVLVTLDYYDGRLSKAGVRDLDQIDTMFLKLTLMQKDVCGMSITKHDGLMRAVDKLTTTEKPDED
jgi:hypothetical protein